MSVSEPFPEQFQDDLGDSDFLLDPQTPVSAVSAEEYQPSPARPDLIGEANEADVLEQAYEVLPLDEEPDI